MNSSTPANPGAPAPDAAKKRLIRWEAVGPFFIFVIIIYLYFALFFDTNARHALEYFGTHANGAEVDIGSLKTSFWHASLEMRDIEVTNADEPTKNSIQFGAVKWDMLWDAILRGKIAIENASILNIQIGSPREHAGRVLPKDPPGTQSGFERMQEQTLQNAEHQYQGNVLGDLAGLLGGEDPQAKLLEIRGSLRSEARMKELQDELKTKQTQWQARLKTLPQNSDIKAIGDRVRNLKTANLKNPLEIQKTLQDAASIAKDTQADINQVKSVATDLNGDLQTYQGQLKELEGMIQSDISDIERRMRLPNINAESMSGLVFGQSFLAKLHKVQFYVNKARHYMPPKKTAAEKAATAPPKPEERAKGRDYRFGRPHAYPLFWLKKGELSSKSQPGDSVGDLDGRILNLTNDQPTLGQPTVLDFKGSFPQQRMSGVSGNIIIDHVTEKAKEIVNMRIGQYIVPAQQLSRSPDASIAFKQANASSDINIALEDDSVRFMLNAGFDQAQYEIMARNKMVEDVLKKTFQSLPKITLQAAAVGSWSNLQLRLDSNVGREIAKSLTAQVSAQIAATRAKVQTIIDSRIGPQKKALLAQFQSSQKLINGDLSSKTNQITQLQTELTKAQGKSGDGDAFKQKGQQQLEDFKKQLGF